MILGYIIAVVVSVVGSVALQKKLSKDMQNKQDGFLVTKTGGSHPLRIVYGKRRVASETVWKGISKLYMFQLAFETDSAYFSPVEITAGNRDSKDYLHRLDVWCQGPVKSIGNFKIDDDKTSHKRFAQGEKAFVRVVNRLGTDNQTMFSGLVSGSDEITEDMKGNGVAYSWSRFLFTADDPEFQGEPTLTAEIEGLKVWDPRENPSDPSIKSHSDNPALCLLDYLLASYGRNLSLADIHLNSFIEAANLCDSEVDLPASQKVDTAGDYYNPETGETVSLQAGDEFPWHRVGQATSTRNRYSCNLILEASNETRDNVSEILKCMKGSLPFIQGKYKLMLEDVGTPVMAFNNDNILGSVSLGYADRSKRLNRCTVKFPNENKAYQPDTVSWPAMESAQHTQYKAIDSGEDLHTEVELTGVTDYYQARDLAEFIVKDSRTQEFIEFKAQPTALTLEVGDVITVTNDVLDFVDREYRVRSLAINANLTVDIKAQRYDDSIYPWNLNDDDSEPAVAEVPPSAFDTPASVTGFGAAAATQMNQDGTATSTIVAVWNDIVPNTVAVDVIEFGYKLTSASAYSWVTLPAGTTHHSVVGLTDLTDFDIAIRYKNKLGKYSATTLATVSTPNANTDLTSIASAAQSDAEAAQADADAALAAIALANAEIVSLASDTAAANLAASNAQATADLKQTAQQVADAIANDTTEIDGSRLIAGSVAASKIDVTGIKTSDLNNDAGFTNNALAQAANDEAVQATADAAAAQAVADAAAESAGEASDVAVLAQSRADDAYALAESKQTAAEVQQAIANDTTSIDGSRIVTGTLDGSDITATSQITVGTGNDVAKLSGSNSHYRFWAGHALPTSAPFSLDKNGKLIVKSASTGQRLELTSDSIKVYDASNNLRVKIGNLA